MRETVCVLERERERERERTTRPGGHNPETQVSRPHWSGKAKCKATISLSGTDKKWSEGGDEKERERECVRE